MNFQLYVEHFTTLKSIISNIKLCSARGAETLKVHSILSISDSKTRHIPPVQKRRESETHLDFSFLQIRPVVVCSDVTSSLRSITWVNVVPNAFVCHTCSHYAICPKPLKLFLFPLPAGMNQKRKDSRAKFCYISRQGIFASSASLLSSAFSETDFCARP